MKFTKMHGCGNDYVYVNCFEERVEHPEELAVKISDRHFGVGSDGLILICPSEAADVRMRMYNADGSEAQMCGNGIRCVAKYAYEHGLVNGEEITVETKAGIKRLLLSVEDGRVRLVTVDMGAPETAPEKIPVRCVGRSVIASPVTIQGRIYFVTCVSMGNPHAVTFVEDTGAVKLNELGPLFEHHEMFPERTNTEFVQIIDDHTIRMRVWERGSGETLACGTGACASAYAGILNLRTADDVTVQLLGGELKVFYDRTSGHLLLTGPAETVYEGEWNEKGEQVHG